MSGAFLKRIFLSLILTLGIFQSVAHADVFDEWKKDPLYKQVMSLCIPGDPNASLATLQAYAFADTAMGVGGGAEGAVFFWRSPQVEKHVADQWASEPFQFALIQCFGNDDHGEFLTKAFLTELVLGYSTTHAITTTLLLTRFLKIAFAGLQIGAMGIRASLSEIEWLMTFLESNPNLLPRLRPLLPWLNRSLLLSGIGVGVKMGYNNGKAVRTQDEEKHKAEIREEDASKATYDQLSREYASCAHPKTCEEIREKIIHLDADWAR